MQIWFICRIGQIINEYVMGNFCESVIISEYFWHGHDANIKDADSSGRAFWENNCSIGCRNSLRHMYQLSSNFVP